ncbi:hypothetical protein [Nocardia caishijiensis]|uniref:DUF8020 domain-containing protein n=1 Tax=Nocardia caishijiensis TaxID=184756 RepID=A0ABQ6YFK5_9NOCA|nr:hypothetical protein [Nocardia caishijiensis]KAF0836759.1 hypothetical protein FNL39_11274 [Nocardia caishijiensis]
MKMRKFAVVAALLAVATGVTAGTVNAAPEQAAPINYTAEVVDESRAVVTTDAGSLVTEDGAFKIKTADGTTVAATPLTFRLDEFELPIAAEISGNTATLTPQLDPAKAVYKPVALPYEDKAPWKSEYEREQAAWSRLTSTISMGATIGTLVGGLGGAAAGCVAGAALGLVATGALATLFGLGPLGGCVAGAAAVGFLGVVAGQLFVTGPVAVAAAIQYFTTINQPFTPPAK